MSIISVNSAKLQEKNVLLRVDFDVPLKPSGKKHIGLVVEDDFRISRSLPTIQLLLKKKAKIIIISHLGRPDGREDELSLKPVAEYLSGLLKYKFMVIDERFHRLPRYTLPHLFFIVADFRLNNIKKLLADLNPGDIAMLENIRYYDEEYRCNKKFARDLSQMGEIYVNDAFAVSHRDQASITELPKLLPAYAGMGLMEEINGLGKIVRRPKRPYALLVGGVKLSDKFSGLEALLESVDFALIGGGLASLFFSAKGYEIGKSKFEKQLVVKAKNLLRNYKDKIILPDDVVVARGIDKPNTRRVITPQEIAAGEMILDIGPKTIIKFSSYLKQAKTMIWSGPLGLFEEKSYSHGTMALGRLFASRSRGLAYGVAGGGNTLAAVKQIKMGEYFDYLSTGGTAMLEYLAGAKLSGLAALESKR